MRFSRTLQLVFICLAVLSASVCADEVQYSVTGVDEPMLTNVRNHVSAYRVGSSAKLNSRLRRKLVADAKIAGNAAMRPYGYFHPQITAEFTPAGEGKWLLNVDVKAGIPVRVQKLHLELQGPGGKLDALKAWYTNFPLAEGRVLNQYAWDNSKQAAIKLLEDAGYLQAGFSRHVIRVDPSANTARLELVLDTGLQAVIGKVTFKQDVLNEGVLDRLKRFGRGAVYNARMLEKFRLDLWRSGYFEDIEVVERRDLGATPPRVDLEVDVSFRKKNTFQSTLGFGTDTLARFQFLWGRHLLSSRGDNFDIGFGWQQKDNEFSMLANYRLPRKTDTQQFWVASVGLKSENQEFQVSSSGDFQSRLDIARGTVTDGSLRLGKTRVRNLQGGFEQLFETVFVQYLNENHSFDFTANVEPEFFTPAELRPFDRLLKRSSDSLAIGVDWDWPEIRGTGFQTVGHHQRAWILTSNKAWGSVVDYSQVYLSSRWNVLAGTNWKFLFRAEAGYSSANTANLKIPVDDGELDIISTDLPYHYRFKAGGSRSVRGYAFELLDTNGMGSNNIFTASAEVEYHFRDAWSAAVFYDVGNAFKDWSKPGLKRGTGFGLRWYSLIGALRLDFAQGLDIDGEPWRIHLTIGTPLL